MSTEKSELHIADIEREDKGRWVSASRTKKISLAQWAIDVLNEASKREIDHFNAPNWAKNLSRRSAHALVNEGYTSKKQVRDDFALKKFEPLQIPNLGSKGVEEVREWLKND